MDSIYSTVTRDVCSFYFIFDTDGNRPGQSKLSDALFLVLCCVVTTAERASERVRTPARQDGRTPKLRADSGTQAPVTRSVLL
jgi:hypothetical protein